MMNRQGMMRYGRRKLDGDKKEMERSANMKWLYRIESTDSIEVLSAERLSRLGEDSWELICVVTEVVGGIPRYFSYFKRPIG